MEKITSTENGLVKKAAKLKQTKHRREEKLFLVENEVTIRDAGKFGVFPEILFLSEEFLDKNPDFAKDFRGSCELREVNKKVNDALSDLATSSGIVAVYSMPEKEPDPKRAVFYLSGVSDPGNLGTILRTSLYFGFQNIVCDEDCADFFSPKTVSAAKDAIFKLNLKKDRDLAWLKGYQSEIFLTDVSAGKNLTEFSFPQKFCLVFGSEGSGIPEKIKKIGTEKIRIEPSGEMESLNVAVAHAIFANHIAGQI